MFSAHVRQHLALPEVQQVPPAEALAWHSGSARSDGDAESPHDRVRLAQEPAPQQTDKASIQEFFVDASIEGALRSGQRIRPRVRPHGASPPTNGHVQQSYLAQYERTHSRAPMHAFPSPRSTGFASRASTSASLGAVAAHRAAPEAAPLRSHRRGAAMQPPALNVISTDNSLTVTAAPTARIRALSEPRGIETAAEPRAGTHTHAATRTHASSTPTHKSVLTLAPQRHGTPASQLPSPALPSHSSSARVAALVPDARLLAVRQRAPVRALQSGKHSAAPLTRVAARSPSSAHSIGAPHSPPRVPSPHTHTRSFSSRSEAPRRPSPARVPSTLSHASVVTVQHQAVSSPSPLRAPVIVPSLPGAPAARDQPGTDTHPDTSEEDRALRAAAQQKQVWEETLANLHAVLHQQVSDAREPASPVRHQRAENDVATPLSAGAHRVAHQRSPQALDRTPLSPVRVDIEEHLPTLVTPTADVIRALTEGSPHRISPVSSRINHPYSPTAVAHSTKLDFAAASRPSMFRTVAGADFHVPPAAATARVTQQRSAPPPEPPARPRTGRPVSRSRKLASAAKPWIPSGKVRRPDTAIYLVSSPTPAEAAASATMKRSASRGRSVSRRPAWKVEHPEEAALLVTASGARPARSHTWEDVLLARTVSAHVPMHTSDVLSPLNAASMFAGIPAAPQHHQGPFTRAPAFGFAPSRQDRLAQQAAMKRTAAVYAAAASSRASSRSTTPSRLRSASRRTR